MKNLPTILAFFAFISLAIVSCKQNNTFGENTPEEIIVSPSLSDNRKVSDLFRLEGHTVLASTSENPLRSIEKAIFADGKIIVLDNRTDFQNIWVFEEATGSLLNKIGHQSETGDGYHELYDIVFSPEKDKITGLVAGKMCFMTYDLSGNLISVLPNGMFGQEMAMLPDGGYVVYNELGASDISGKYHLIYYDEKGNLTKRTDSYPEYSDGWGYDYTGFMTTANNRIWYSPPFSDTIFTVTKKGISPAYIFNFQGKEVPVQMRKKKLSGWDTDHHSFLCEGWVKTEQYALFHFFEDHKTSLGIYDELSGNFYHARSFEENDPLFPLIQVGDIFQKTSNSFALALEPARIQYLIRQHKVNLDELKRISPDLVRALIDTEADKKYILLYFSTKL